MKTIHLIQRAKKVSKRMLSLSLILFLMFSCNKNENFSEKVELVSPEGYVLAESLDELLTFLDLSKGSKIVDVSFMETDQAVMGFVTYTGEDGITNTVGIGSGNINYEAERLIVQRGLKSSKDKVTVSCSGCENCRVMGTIYPDGTMTVNCESSCCTMTIEGGTEIKPVDP